MQDFIAVVYAIMFFLIIPAIILYVLSSIGLYRLAANKGIASPFLAWLPYGRDYLLGEIIGEKVVFFSPVVPYAQWILLFAPVAISILSFAQPIGAICTAVFALYAYCAHYRLFKLYRPNSAMLYLVLSIILPFLLPIFVFVIRNDVAEEYLPEDSASKGQNTAPKSNGQNNAAADQTVSANDTAPSMKTHSYQDVANDLNIGKANTGAAPSTSTNADMAGTTEPDINMPSHNTPNPDIANMKEPDVSLKPDDPFAGVKAKKTTDPFADDYKNVPHAPNADDAAKGENK